MTQISLQVPVLGAPNSTEAPKIINDFAVLQTSINGNLDATNLTTAAAQAAGMNQIGQTVKGASIVATSQSTGSTSFTTLATPDQVTGIVLTSAGLIEVSYFATWQDSVSLNGSAAIFLNSNQLSIASSGSSAPVVQQCVVANHGVDSVATNYTLFSTPYGLDSFGNTSYSGDVTTGQVVGALWTGGGSVNSIGGPVKIFAGAGTYTVSVRFKAASGTVTASNRRLYVQASSFA